MEQNIRNLSKMEDFLPMKITLLFNTDGIPLYKSSKVNIWPVFLAINELPPEERFAKKI